MTTMLGIKKTASRIWGTIRLRGRDPYSVFAETDNLSDWLMDAMFRVAEKECKRKWEQDLADAHAAAASGEGPQPWDRDWIETDVCIQDNVRDIADAMGWHRTQDLLEVLSWALASPQGQRALALAGDPNSPWQGALDMIEDLRRPLMEASHQMISTRAWGLGYTGCLKDDLDEAMEELTSSLYNVTTPED